MALVALACSGPERTPTGRPADGPRPPVVGERATIRYPTSGGGPIPTVVMVHGGAFTEGDRDDAHLEVVAARFREAGYATVSVDYRLGAEIPAALARFRAQTGADYDCDPTLPAAGTELPSDLGGPGRPCLVYLRVIARASADLRSALADLRSRGPELGLAVERLALYGESAGSTLVIPAAVDPGPAGGVAAVVGVASGGQVPRGESTASVLLVTYRDAAVELPDLVGTDQAAILRANAAALSDRGADAELLELPGKGHVPEAGTADLDRLIERSLDLYRRAGVGPS